MDAAVTVARAVTAAFHDSGQPADIGAERDRPEPAQADYQEADHSGCERRGDQHADPIAIGQQPHRHGAQQTQPPACGRTTAMIAIAAHSAPITDACASSLGCSDRA